MNKFFTTLLGALIGMAFFAAVGIGMANAHNLGNDDGYGIVSESAGGR